jgi:hypothetical protein
MWQQDQTIHIILRRNSAGSRSVLDVGLVEQLIISHFSDLAVASDVLIHYTRSSGGVSDPGATMSPKLSSYSSPLPIGSSLFRNPPDTVPPTDELEALQAELERLKQRTLERAKKAGEDLKLISESMRRMKEREKGKAKLVEKVKRERDCTYNFANARPCNFSPKLIMSPLSCYIPDRFIILGES